MLVRDVMSSPAVSVPIGASVKEAARILDRRAVTAAPVLDGDRLVGVVSEADLIREMLPADPRSQVEAAPVPTGTGRRTVDEVMTRMPVTVRPDEDLAAAVDLLTSTTIKSLPVVEHGRVVGVLSRRDVIRVLARDDERIEAEVNELFRADDTDWVATVSDGAVEVVGPRGAPERRVAEVLAASVTGVVAVRVAVEPARDRRPH